MARQSVEVTSDCTVASASVDLDVRHSYVADLRVVLRSPTGTQVTLHDHGGGSRANLVTSFDWNARRGALQTLAGENARGRWEVAVHDDAGADTGSFRAFTLHLSCGDGVVAAAPPSSAATTAAPPAAEDPAGARRPRTRTRTVIGARPPPRGPDVLDPFAGRAPTPPQPWQSPSTTGRTNGPPRPSP